MKVENLDTVTYVYNMSLGFTLLTLMHEQFTHMSESLSESTQCEPSLVKHCLTFMLLLLPHNDHHGLHQPPAGVLLKCLLVQMSSPLHSTTKPSSCVPALHILLSASNLKNRKMNLPPKALPFSELLHCQPPQSRSVLPNSSDTDILSSNVGLYLHPSRRWRNSVSSHLDALLHL